MEEKRREGKQMKKVKNKIIGIMGIIGLSLFLGMITPIEVQAGGRVSPIISCAVPLPPSKEGEEKKDIISAAIGMATLLVIVCGGIVVLKKKYGEKQE